MNVKAKNDFVVLKKTEQLSESKVFVPSSQGRVLVMEVVNCSPKRVYNLSFNLTPEYTTEYAVGVKVLVRANDLDSYFDGKNETFFVKDKDVLGVVE